MPIAPRTVSSASIGFRRVFERTLIALLVLCAATAARAQTPTTGPYRASSDRRYLVDAQGAPFFVHGDSAWSAITNLTQAEALTYLDNTRTVGFNAVLVNFIEHRFSSNPPANASGVRPFSSVAFQSTPNSAYFDHVRWFVQAAAQRGIVVFANPAYLGNGGGVEGWHQELEAASLSQAQGWGTYVAGQVGSQDNVVWHLFGDFDPPSHAKTNAVQAGLLGAAPQHTLFSHHYARGVSSHENPEPWLTWNYLYSPASGHPHVETLAGYNAAPIRPQIFGEGFYEHDPEFPSTEHVRRQSWAALTSGAGGYFYGNRRIWGFGHGYEPVDWQAALDDPGRMQMAHVKTFFVSRSWWQLQPDQQSTLVTAGRGALASSAYVTAALAADRSWAVAYLPGQAGTITVNRTRLVSTFQARWFNPQTGAYTPIGSMPNTGTRQFTKPDSNDWVLVLEGLPAPATAAVPATLRPLVSVLALTFVLIGTALLRRSRS